MKDREHKFDANDILISMAKGGIDKQVIKKCDYYDIDGILICGVCYEPRQVREKLDDGRVIKWVRQCRCERESEKEEQEKLKLQKHMQRVAALRKASGIPPLYEGAVFDTFISTKSNEENLKICKDYVKHFPAMKGKSIGILMYGNVGTGKSFAASCIANALIEQEVSVVMVSVVSLIDELRSSEFSDKEESAYTYSRLTTADMLILDDFGAERSTDFAIERLYDIINTRYRENRPMIVTTNLTLDGMAKCTDIRYERIFTRIVENSIPMEFTGKNWRWSLAKRNYETMKKIFNEDPEDGDKQ